MSMRQVIALYSLCVVLGIAAGGYVQARSPEQPQVSVTAAPQEVTIADPITYTVRIVAPAGVEIKPAEEMIARGIFTVRSQKEIIRQNGPVGIVRERIYELAVFEVGAQSIPAYPVMYRQAGATDWQTLESDTVQITVKSVLEKAGQRRLRPLKPKLSRWDRGLWGFLGLLALTGAAVALWRWFHTRKQNAASSMPVVPAHTIAFRELEELRQARLVEQGKMAEFFSRLSGCVRHYLENRFHLRAPQMSTEEFLEIAKISPLLQGEQKRLLKDFLSLADLVKFARYGSSPVEAEHAYNAARHFVEQTKEELTEEAGKTT